ncbi:hypothetical protein SDC9_84164 [bioreactor metagenome]|uniref:Uncharacterized protein n=1 Tax=bioreactor metagenome TaxID=1076179 RepID=A0A644Z9I5_9ZZZZ
MHIAVFRWRVAGKEPVGHGLVVLVVLAGVCGKQAGNGADRTLDKTQRRRIRVDDGFILQSFVNLGHIRLPERRRFVPAGGPLLELVGGIIVPDPERGRIIRRDARKINTRVVGVRARLAGDGHIRNFCLGARTGLDRIRHHIH